MPKILLPNGNSMGAVLNPGDVLVSGEKSILDKVGIAGQDPSQISTASVIAQGQDEDAAAVAVPGIFSPRFRRTTTPEISPAAEVPRRTTRSSY